MRAGAESSFQRRSQIKVGLTRLSDMLQNGITAMMEPSFPNSTFEGEYPALKAEADKTNRYMVFSARFSGTIFFEKEQRGRF